MDSIAGHETVREQVAIRAGEPVNVAARRYSHRVRGRRAAAPYGFGACLACSADAAIVSMAAGRVPVAPTGRDLVATGRVAA